jgi:hypothetical protein
MVFLLKDFIEKIQQFISNCISMFASLIKILVLSKFNTKLPKAIIKEAIVIGNGPSFKKSLAEAPSFFENKELICVNAFPSSPEYELLRPSKLVWLDNAFYPQKGVALREDIKELIEAIINKTTWELKIFLPQLSRSATHLQELKIKNSNIQLCYFNYTIIKGFDWFSYFFYKRNAGMPLCQNVVVASIFLSINIGYENIYLIGVENSFFKDIVVSDENEVYLQHSHFYDKDNKGSLTKIHVRPGSPIKADISEVLTMAVKTFKGYKTLRKYGDYRGTTVYNITEGSYVDAFERKKITNLK